MGREVWNPTGCIQPPLALAQTSSPGQLPPPRHQLQGVLFTAKAGPVLPPTAQQASSLSPRHSALFKDTNGNTYFCPRFIRKGIRRLEQLTEELRATLPPTWAPVYQVRLATPWEPSNGRPPQETLPTFWTQCNNRVMLWYLMSHNPPPPPSANTGNLGSTPQAATAIGRSHVHVDGVVEEATGRGQAKKLAPSCHPMSSGRTCGDHCTCADFLSLFGGGISHRRTMYGPRHSGGYPRNGPHKAPGRAVGTLTPNSPGSCLLVSSRSLVEPAQLGQIQVPPPPPGIYSSPCGSKYFRDGPITHNKISHLEFHCSGQILCEVVLPKAIEFSHLVMGELPPTYCAHHLTPLYPRGGGPPRGCFFF